MLKLSKRLETIASFVPAGSRIADVGTDHGYIPISLVERGTALSALAMDVRQGPLLRARAHVQERGLGDKISLRLGDGLSSLESGEADTVIIAGMGGELIIHIMEEGRRLWPEIGRWILSPHSEIFKVRRFLREAGFSIAREAMVKDEGKFYTVMEALPAPPGDGEEPRAIDDLYGGYLIRRKDPVLKEYLKLEREKSEALLASLAGAGSGRGRERARELRCEIDRIMEAEYEMQ